MGADLSDTPLEAHIVRGALCRPADSHRETSDTDVM